MVSEGKFRIKSFKYDVFFSCLYSQLLIQTRKKNHCTYFNSKLTPLIEIQVFSTIVILKAFLGLLPSSKAKGKHMHGTIFLLSVGEYAINV